MSKYKVKFEGSISVENIDEQYVLDRVEEIFQGIASIVYDMDDGTEILSFDVTRIEEEVI